MDERSLFFLWYSCGIPGGHLDWAVCLLTSPDARTWTSAHKTVLTSQTSNVVLPLGKLQPNLPAIAARNGQLVLSFSTIPCRFMPPETVDWGRSYAGASYEGRVMLIYTSSNGLDWRQIPSTTLCKDVCSVAYDPHTDSWLWSLRAGPSMRVIVCMRACVFGCALQYACWYVKTGCLVWVRSRKSHTGILAGSFTETGVLARPALVAAVTWRSLPS